MPTLSSACFANALIENLGLGLNSCFKSTFREDRGQPVSFNFDNTSPQMLLN
jgi:hypothetical protein